VIHTAEALLSPGRLREFFHASSIALVGASDSSGWARNIFEKPMRSGGHEVLAGVTIDRDARPGAGTRTRVLVVTSRGGG
jgi:hypothetical protein